MVSQGCGATPSRYLLHGRFEYLAKHNGMIGSRIGVWQISTQEGSRPSWSRNGRELFFLGGRERVNTASIAVSGDTLVPGAATAARDRLLSRIHDARRQHPRYDVTDDHQRFLMIKGSTSTSGSRSEMTIVLNWPPTP